MYTNLNISRATLSCLSFELARLTFVNLRFVNFVLDAKTILLVGPCPDEEGVKGSISLLVVRSTC
jgi:hypothetical protein